MRTILITGGTSGIGLMLAEHFLKGKNTVIISSSTRKNLDAAKEKLNEYFESEKAFGFICDIASKDSVKTLKSSIKTLGLKPDSIINCAAIIGPTGPFADNDFDEWEKAVAIDLVGNARIIHEFLPALIENNGEIRGKIINLAGGGAGYARPGYTAYASSKTAMVRLTETVGVEYKGIIDINVIAPGAHDTAIWKVAQADQKPKEFADKEKLFSLTDYLLSDKSDGVTGRFIHIMNPYNDFDKSISDTDRYLLRRTN